jgi:DNA-binding transcriptional ArsR family regulator
VGELLALLTGDPERTWTAEKLADLTGGAYPTVTRELRLLETAGLIRAEHAGRTKLLRANPTSPYFRPLAELMAMSFGPPLVLAEELADVAGIDAAFIYGSWASRQAGQPGPAPNDIDFLVLGTPDRDELHDAARRAEQRLGRPINVTVRTTKQWQASTDGFTRQLKSSPLIPVLERPGAYRGHDGPVAQR